jgi:hypothetical protein
MPITLHTTADEVIPEQTELAAGRERDEFQQTVDRDVEALKIKTAAAGWPVVDPKQRYHRYVVGADDRAALKSVIRRAMVLNHVEAVWYKDLKTEAGHFVVKFHVARKLDKDNKPVKDDTLTVDGKPKMTLAGQALLPNGTLAPPAKK